MKIAMGVLAVLAVIGGVVNIPHVLEPLHHFLEPTFADSRALRGARALEPGLIITRHGRSARCSACSASSSPGSCG